jgi:hypothetical protein
VQPAQLASIAEAVVGGARLALRVRQLLHALLPREDRSRLARAPGTCVTGLDTARAILGRHAGSVRCTPRSGARRGLPTLKERPPIVAPTRNCAFFYRVTRFGLDLGA